jgi:hypothetical protein
VGKRVEPKAGTEGGVTTAGKYASAAEIPDAELDRFASDGWRYMMLPAEYDPVRAALLGKDKLEAMSHVAILRAVLCPDGPGTDRSKVDLRHVPQGSWDFLCHALSRITGTNSGESWRASINREREARGLIPLLPFGDPNTAFGWRKLAGDVKKPKAKTKLGRKDGLGPRFLYSITGLVSYLHRVEGFEIRDRSPNAFEVASRVLWHKWKYKRSASTIKTKDWPKRPAEDR